MQSGLTLCHFTTVTKKWDFCLFPASCATPMGVR